MIPSNSGQTPVFCQWEIWQAWWEHEDGTRKDRPVLILSSTPSANANDAIWVAKFTKTHFPGIPSIKFVKGDPSFAQTGLSDTCYLYPSQARKIARAKFIRPRGKLSIFSAALIAVVIKQLLKFDIQ